MCKLKMYTAKANAKINGKQYAGIFNIFRALNFVRCCFLEFIYREENYIYIMAKSYFSSSIGCEKKYSDDYWKEIEHKMRG